MKILAIAKPKESLLSLTPDKYKELSDASRVLSKKIKDEGKVVASYFCPTSGYLFTILDYDTTEEWMKDIMAGPLLNYYDQETYPVVDFDDAMKIAGVT